MPQVESQDAAAVLEDFTYRSQNLPAEIQFMQEEIADKDRTIQECLAVITSRDNAIQKWIRQMGSHTPNPKEEQLARTIRESYEKITQLQEEKCALAQKTQIVVDKHLRYLDTQIKILQEKGDFPNDPDIPSLLRPQPADRSHLTISDRSGGPLSQITNSASVSALSRLTGQPASLHRMTPSQAQAQQVSSIAASAPATPAAAMLLNRQAREGSAGASNKRQRLNSNTGSLPTTSSGLARHASAGPGTPKAGTPAAGRAGSAGPRASQKTTAGVKKVAPHKQATARKAKPGKSGLSRVKRTGTKNSPSSTNDSELSEAESGSGDDDDDEPTTPKSGADGDGDGDDDMGDGDDDEGGDDRKYCTCQSVSYGDMVACDNEKCPYEWFHWSCVGLKSEPVGTWICPPCTKALKKGT